MDDKLRDRIKQRIAKCDKTIREAERIIDSCKDSLAALHKNQAQSRISQIDPGVWPAVLIPSHKPKLDD